VEIYPERPDWLPQRPLLAAGNSYLLATSVVGGVRCRISNSGVEFDFREYLARWLRSFHLRNQGNGLELCEYTFMYVVLGTTIGNEPEGNVDGVSVLEAGFGGDHAGPPDGIPISGDVLFHEAISFLSAGW
jgi:hypothetical protein